MRLMEQPSPEFLLPVSMEEFFSTYWEHQPLHINRSAHSALAQLNLQRVESVLSASALYYPGVQVTHAGHNIEPGSYVDEDNRILAMRLFEKYSLGATIVLSQAQKLFPELNDLCRDVVRTMKMRCQTNVYISPPGRQGFNAHYDTHDVFILQVAGAKTFNFYPSTVELPMPEERFDAARLTSSTIDESITLSEGDTLYIPRGVVHDAVADETLHSIHVTLGVYPFLLRDYLDELINPLLLSNKRFRKSALAIQSSAGDQCSTTEGLRQVLDQMKSVLDKPGTAESIQSKLLDKLCLDSVQDCRGLVHNITTNAYNDDGSANFASVTLNRHMIINWEKMHSGLKLRSHGQILEFSEPIASLVTLLLERKKLAVDDMSFLELQLRTALISRLLQENIITLE